jgi:hypothetical protein
MILACSSTCSSNGKWWVEEASSTFSQETCCDQSGALLEMDECIG